MAVSSSNIGYINPVTGGYSNTLTPAMQAEGWVANPGTYTQPQLQQIGAAYNQNYVAGLPMQVSDPYIQNANDVARANQAYIQSPTVPAYNSYIGAVNNSYDSARQRGQQNVGANIAIGSEPYMVGEGISMGDAERAGTVPQGDWWGNMIALGQMYPDNPTVRADNTNLGSQNQLFGAASRAYQSGDMKAAQAAGAAAGIPDMILDTSGWGNHQGPNGYDANGDPVSVSALMQFDSPGSVAQNALSNWAKQMAVSGTPAQAYDMNQLGQYWGLSGAARGVDVWQGMNAMGSTFQNPIAIGFSPPSLGINDKLASGGGQNYVSLHPDYMTFAHEMQEQLQPSGNPDSSDYGAGGTTIKGGGGGDPMGADFAKASQTYWSQNQGGGDPSRSSWQNALMPGYNSGSLMPNQNNNLALYKGQTGANEYPATTIEKNNPLSPGTPINQGLTPQMPTYNSVPIKSGSQNYGIGPTGLQGNGVGWGPLPGGGTPQQPIYVSKDGRSYTNDPVTAAANGMLLDPHVINAPFPQNSNVGNPNLPPKTNGKATPGYTNVSPESQAWINANANWKDPRPADVFQQWLAAGGKDPTPPDGGGGGPINGGGGPINGGGGGTGPGTPTPGGVKPIIPFDSSDKAYNQKYGGGMKTNGTKTNSGGKPTGDDDDDRDTGKDRGQHEVPADHPLMRSWWRKHGGAKKMASGGYTNPQPIIPFPKSGGVHAPPGTASQSTGTTSGGQSPDAGPSFPGGEWWNQPPPTMYSDSSGNNYPNPTQDQIDQLGLTKMTASQSADLPDPNMPDYMGQSPWPSMGGPLHLPSDPWAPGGNVNNPMGPNPPMPASPDYGMGPPGAFNFQPPPAAPPGGGTGGGGHDHDHDHGGGQGGGFTSTGGGQYYSWSDPGAWLSYMNMTPDQAVSNFGNDWAQQGGWSGGWPGDTGGGGGTPAPTGGVNGYADFGAWDKAEDAFHNGQGNLVASQPWLDAGAAFNNQFGPTALPTGGIWGAGGDANEDLAESWLQQNWGKGTGNGGGGGGAGMFGIDNVGTNQGGTPWASPPTVPLGGPGVPAGAGTTGAGTMHAQGGPIVPGQAEHPGDTEKNDKVKALLSPGEIVLPRSIAQDPQAPQKAAAFVAAVMARRSPSEALRRAHGG